MDFLTTTQAADLTMTAFLTNIGGALAIGLFLAVMYMVGGRTTKSMVGTVALLPAVVAMVIMMVNGSIGAGVAVAGAFSLVRFRSVPGSAREIATLFLAMSTGLACGMGQLLYGAVFAAVMGVMMTVYSLSPLGNSRKSLRRLVVTIPEDLDYTGVFDDLMREYTQSSSLERVKTTNMGSMLKLTYTVDLKDEAKEQAFLNDLRCRNGNLEISMSRHLNENKGSEL